MPDLFGNHIVGFPTRWLKYCYSFSYVLILKLKYYYLPFDSFPAMAEELGAADVSEELVSMETDDHSSTRRFPASTKYCVNLVGDETLCRRPCVDVSTVYRQDNDGDTLLHVAIINLDADAAAYFIESTPSPYWLDIRNNLSQTPLHIAVLTRQVTIVRQLVVAAVDVNARDRHGNTPLHLACREGFLDIVGALMKPVSFEEQQRNNYLVSFENIHERLDLNLLNFDGLSCLHVAASTNQTDIIKHLLQNGADVNVKEEKSGRTILHEAASTGNLQLVRLLVSLDKCDLNAMTYDGCTPFDLARARGHWIIVAELAKLDRENQEEN